MTFTRKDKEQPTLPGLDSLEAAPGESLGPALTREHLTLQDDSLSLTADTASLETPSEGDDTPDVFKGVAYTGNTEKDTAAELAALETGFARRAKEEAQRFQTTVDSEYWCALVFDTREQ